MSQDKQIIVVVISRYWPTALSIIRSLGAAGFIVDLVSSASEKDASVIAASSKYVRRSFETVCKSVKRIDDPELLKVLLDNYDTDPEETLVLFPTDDYTASFIDRHRDQLTDIFKMPTALDGTQGSITGLMDKSIQGRLAYEAGLLCPKEWVVSLRDEISIPGDVVFPVFCKPLESVAGFKGEMKKCDNFSELKDHLLFLKSRNQNRDILIQEYLRVDSELDISGVCRNNEVFIPAIIEKTHIGRHERGVTVAGRIESTDRIKSILPMINQMLRRCNYVGMFDMEFMCSGSDLYFGELNLRSGGPNYAYYLSGSNLPKVAVKAILGEPLDKETEIVDKFGSNFVYEKVAWKEYLTGYLQRKELKRILRAADFLLISSSDDNRPVEVFHKELQDEIKQRQSKKTKKVIRRIAGPIVRRVQMVAQGYPQTKPGNAKVFSNKPRVMVIGRNYSSNLCMARSLGMAGYDVEVMRIMPKKEDRTELTSLIPEAYSKYVKSFYTCQQGNGRQICNKLKRLIDNKEKRLLIPTDDVSAYIIDEHYKEMSDLFYIPDAGKKQGGIIRLMSKHYQKQMAAESGLLTVNSKLVKIENGNFDIPEDIHYPCFIKPDISRRTSKKRMQRCDSEKELRAALEGIADTIDLDILVEDYVEIRRELSLLGLKEEDTVLCPGLFEAQSGGHGSRKGVAATGRSIPIMEISHLMDSIISLLKSSEYNGLFDIDFIETQTGEIVFVELNLRYGASGYVLTRSGVNLPGVMADYILKRTPIDSTFLPDKTGRTFVSEKVLIEEYADQQISEDDMINIMDSAEIHFIMDENDIKPYRHFMRTFEKVKNSEKRA